MQFNAQKTLGLQVILVNISNLHWLEVGRCGSYVPFLSRYLTGDVSMQIQKFIKEGAQSLKWPTGLRNNDHSL